MQWKDILNKNNVDALLLSDSNNIRYTTGFHGVSDHEREGYVLLTRHATFLFTFWLYQEEAKACVEKNEGLNLQFIGGDTSLSKLLRPILAEPHVETLGIESESMTVKEFNDLSEVLSEFTLTPTTRIIETLRMKKTKEEIENLRQAAQITDECFTYIQTCCTQGVTERELCWKIEQYFREHGASNSFTPIVAFNEHASIPHHTSTDAVLRAPSLILLDFGAAYHGYHADMTRVIFYGQPKEEWIKAYETTITAQQTALDYLNSEKNPSGAKADELTRAVIEKAGYPTYSHSLGHGVGLEIHEFPRLTIHKDYELEENTVFSVEPGIYMSGEFGIRIEDLVLKQEKGIEILSKSDKKVIIIA